jgi:hypothetical protein
LQKQLLELLMTEALAKTEPYEYSVDTATAATRW